MSEAPLWKVAVDAPLPEALTYAQAPDLTSFRRGQLVTVPLGKGNRSTKGLILGRCTSVVPNNAKLKSILHLDQDYPTLSEPFVKWIEWLSNYYIYPIGRVAQLAYPPLRKQEKPRKSNRSPVIPSEQIESPPLMTEEQARCVNAISQFKNFSSHLVFGVTGSGKTEIYLRLLEKVLNEGKSGVVLVPEISLTPQLIQRFARRFGDKIAAIHSQLTDRERTNQWWDLIEGRKSILIGARSALFCPLPNVGMIIVDEEHEPSYKQDEKLKYHGRDAAVMLAKFIDCPIVLGSATPSLETWKNALDGKYQLHQLKSRVANRALPTITVVDLRDQKSSEELQQQSKEKYSNLPFWLTPTLYEKIQETLKNNDQVALFLNRRGVAQMIICPACGHTRECPNCDINLTLHAQSHLICHYCDYHENLKEHCPDCKEGHLEAIGLGTELLEKDLAKLFPGHKISRADRDEIQNRSELETLISEMETGEIDILVGTQMIAKGLDFPKLKLVGLVLADVGFNLPDFRATERSFQLITQMSGRSGRHVREGEDPGAVIVQTFNPEHESLIFAQKNDFIGFASHELSTRAQLNYPPSGKLLGFRIQGSKLSNVESAARLLSKRAQSLKSQFTQYQRVEILGPAEAPLAKLRGQFRFHLLIKGNQASSLNSFARQTMGDEDWVPSGIRIIIDVDPINLL
ncbi:MAG: primosomal protein N' [Bdellovibrionaceae bacterium]|nr:primosomal protein N' [Pseudobdellovibrionaceae bacterium]